MPHKIAFTLKVAQQNGLWYVFRKDGSRGKWFVYSDGKPNKRQALKEMNRLSANIPVGSRL